MFARPLLVALGALLIGSSLAAARPVEISVAGVRADAADGMVSLPTPAGGVMRFAVAPTSVVAPALARRYPGNLTWAGEGVDDPHSRVALGVGPRGAHAMVITPRGAWYIDRGTDGRYRSARGDADHPAHDRQPPLRLDEGPAPWGLGKVFPAATGDQLTTYRLALATTGEYAQVFGGTKPLVHAELVRAVARVNAIYESEVAARFELVAANDNVIFLDAGADPYTNNDANAMLGQNQSTLDAQIGSANYDIGHVFSTGGGGLAALGSVGSASIKAMGVTGSANPTGDAFWVDYVAHEIGHQMGAEHSFAGTVNACSSNGNAPTAMEPGSGSTIMAYAGICGADNLQANSDPFFHATSYAAIRAEMDSKPAVGSDLATGNTPPSVAGGSDYTVPPRTPLRLEASGSDIDGNPLTYSWEQFDNGFLAALFAEPKGGGALLRSRPPTTSPARHLPQLSSVLAGATNAATGSCAGSTNPLACWSEYLPTSDRTLAFRVTARDGLGGVATDDVLINVTGSTPFSVTSPSGPASLEAGDDVTVTWEVASTTDSPYDVATVDILLSSDGGATWPHVLAAGATNDGVENVDLPAVTAANARIMVRANGNVFYAVNDAPLTLAAPPGPTPGPAPSPTPGEPAPPADPAPAPPQEISSGVPIPNVWSGPLDTLRVIRATRRVGNAARHDVWLSNRGAGRGTFDVTLCRPSRAFSVVWRGPDGRIIPSGAWRSPVLEPGRELRLRVAITPTRRARAGQAHTCRIVASGAGQTSSVRLITRRR